MKEYSVTYCDSIDQLVITINENIKMGWAPLGGICVMSHDRKLYEDECRTYYQAMVKL